MGTLKYFKHKRLSFIETSEKETFLKLNVSFSDYLKTKRLDFKKCRMCQVLTRLKANGVPRLKIRRQINTALVYRVSRDYRIAAEVAAGTLSVSVPLPPFLSIFYQTDVC